MVLFGERLSNKAVILPIHYSSRKWCCSQKQQLGLPQPLIPAAALVPLSLYSLSPLSAELSRELVLVGTSQGNTELLVLRQISFLIHLSVSGTKFAPDSGRGWQGVGDAQERRTGAFSS